MLLIVLVWWLIGLIITLIGFGRGILAGIRSKKYSMCTVIFGTVILSFMSPVLFILGAIKAIIDTFTNEDES